MPTAPNSSFSLVDLEAKVAELEEQHAKCIAKAERLRSDAESLRRTLEILGSNQNFASSTGNAEPATRGMLSTRVVDAVSEAVGDFSSDEISEAIRKKYADFEFDRTSVSGVLKRLVDSGRLAYKVVPSGRRAARFVKKEQS